MERRPTSCGFHIRMYSRSFARRFNPSAKRRRSWTPDAKEPSPEVLQWPVPTNFNQRRLTRMEAVLEGTAKTFSEQDATRKQVRGSSLFLFGRVLSLGINFFTQVLMVRYFSTRDFGVLA